MSETPRTDKWVEMYDINRNTAIHALPMDMEEELKNKDAVIADMGKRFDKLGSELSDMTSERDAARDMLILKERCDMPADYTAMVKRLEAERDAIKNLADVIARDYAEVVREFNKVKATLADYKEQLCKPDDCERVKRLEGELAKVREDGLNVRKTCDTCFEIHDNQTAIDILDGNQPPINWRNGEHSELLRKLCEHLESYDSRGALLDMYENKQIDAGKAKRIEEVKRLYVCSKAGCIIDCGQCVLGAPHAGFYILGKAFRCRFANDNICVIRYRRPLEVVVIKQMNMARRVRNGFPSHSDNWWRHHCTARLLLAILKEGRKA